MSAALAVQSRVPARWVDGTAGANVWAATFIARALGPTHNVVTVLPDRAERCFSTALI
jgi:cysteine synthase A